MTITGGATFTDNYANNSGGAVFNNTGDFSIDGDATFTNNDSQRDASTDDGGAIWSSGNIIHTNGTITFENNDAWDGGAVYMDTGKTFSAYTAVFNGNTASGGGGAIVSRGLAITNGATFQNNSATNYTGGAIYNTTNPVSINGTILFDNNDAGTGTDDWGGSIYSAADVTLNDVSGSSIFKNCQAQVGGAIFVNSAATLTMTNATFDSNYASNAGGAIRIYGGTLTDVTFTNNYVPNDGGAIYNGTNLLTINGTANTFTSNHGGTDSGDQGGTIFSSGSLTISNASFIGRNDGTADAYEGGAIFTYDTGDVLTISDSSFDSFYAVSIGGAIRMYGGTLSDVIFTNNYVTDDGGAICNATSTLTINGTANTFTGNYAGTASGDVGGTIVTSGSVNISNASFTGRNDGTADAYEGGAIYLYDTSDVLTVSNSSFDSFKAVNVGGAMRMYGGTLTDVTFTGNNVTNSGGAIINTTGALAIDGTANTFTGNYAGTASGNVGGSIYTSGSLTISNAAFTGRNDGTADAYEGGAIRMYDATDVLTLTDSSFDSFKAGNVGGAVRSYGGTISRSTFSNNTVAGASNDGGAIFNTNTLNVFNSTFSANSVTDLGGAIWQSGNATIKNSTFYDNTAGTGEAIYANSGTVTAANTIVAKSTASASLCTGVTSNDYNLQYNGTCFTAQAHDQSGDPLLGALADNGGPTETHAINVGSPAIDNGLGSVCTDADVNSVDQRGETRTTTCDIGSFEL